MAKYFSGITVNGNKYSICIIDDNLNVIFMDNLEIDKLADLLKRKSVTALSVDFPGLIYQKNDKLSLNKDSYKITLKKRAFDNTISLKSLYTYQDKFTPDKEYFNSALDLINKLNKLGFSFNNQNEGDKPIIESYPDSSFYALGLAVNNPSSEDIIKRKYDILKNKGMRIKDFFNKNMKDYDAEINVLCQAYTSYLYFNNEFSSIGSDSEGHVVIPGKDSISRTNGIKEFNKISASDNRNNENKFHRSGEKNDHSANGNGRAKNNGRVISSKVYSENGNSAESKAVADKPIAETKLSFDGKAVAEYCGAQYLYTNVDGIIRINDLRPIKSYRPFTEIYEMRHIKQVQVVIGTTDGLRKVKANLIPNYENSNSFKAAEDEDKKKLDNFWGNHGDKRGYLIKFNKVEVIKA
ncbi:hypothetical protein OXPF_22250 [Oxobacter pfennigii]|uniref:Uncharacterized protein n=1 Tax=Oxobacter pfennigii TaxID=36849 RepID=A0A0P8W8L3_9CLOT|nr:hypothetical protein [Oxobacter pfennigii]KPU44059.1 hypothetical protein OXPF_22250 [Oxobacter pfennigii]